MMKNVEGGEGLDEEQNKPHACNTVVFVQFWYIFVFIFLVVALVIATRKNKS